MYIKYPVFPQLEDSAFILKIFYVFLVLINGM